MASERQFGEWPLHVRLDEENNYVVAPQDVASAEAAAIPETFPLERYAIMQARAAAFGYKLEASQ